MPPNKRIPVEAWAPKIPEMQNDRDGFVEGNPDMVGKLGSGFGDWKTESIFCEKLSGLRPACNAKSLHSQPESALREIDPGR